MDGLRVRCVCGTVFNPAQDRACPGCGTLSDVKREQVAKPDSQGTPAQNDCIPGDRVGGSGDAAVGFAKYKNLMLGIGGVAVLIVAAMVVRSMGRPSNADDSTDSGPSANRNALTSDDHSPRSESRSSKNNGPAPTVARSVADRTTTEVPAGIAAFRGSWRLRDSNMQAEPVVPGIPISGTVISQTVAAAFNSADATAQLTVDERGSYSIDVGVTGDGFYLAELTPNRWKPTERAEGVVTLTPNGLAVTDRADDSSVSMVESDMPHLNAKAGDTQLVLQRQGGSGFTHAFFYRPGGSGQLHTSIVGAWTNQQVWVDSFIAYRATLEFRDDGSYRIRFTRSERGLLEVGDGKYEFKRSIAMGPPVQGRYEFDGPDRFTLIEPRGTVTWVRDRE